MSQASSAGCAPLAGATVDIWQCDAEGRYSDVSDRTFDTSGQKFLRGSQVTDASGRVQFTTIYPGWYPGRAVHIHFKVRTDASAGQGYEFTSQFFFDEALTSAVHALSPYDSKGTCNVRNTTDGIYNTLSAAEKVALTLQTAPIGDGYAGVINLAVNVG